MKLFRTNMALFVALPVFVTMYILSYMMIIYARSSVYANTFNLSFDVILLVYYFSNFVYKIRMDDEWIIFYSALKSNRFKRSELGFVMSSSIMTKFVCKKKNYYILTTKNGSLELRNMLKGIINEDENDK